MKNRLLAAILSMAMVLGGMTMPVMAEEIAGAEAASETTVNLAEVTDVDVIAQEDIISESAVLNENNELLEENIVIAEDVTSDNIEYLKTVNPSFDKVVKALSADKHKQNLSNDKNDPYYKYSDYKGDNSGSETVGYDYHLDGDAVNFSIGTNKEVFHSEDNYRMDNEMLSLDYKFYPNEDGSVSIKVTGMASVSKGGNHEDYKLYTWVSSEEGLHEIAKAIAVGPSYDGGSTGTVWTLDGTNYYDEGYTAEPGVLINKYYGACYDRISKSLGKLTSDTTLTCAKLINNETVAEDRQVTNEPISYNPMKKNAYNAVVKAIKAKGSAAGDGHLYTLNRTVTGTDGKKYSIGLSYTDNSPSYDGGPLYRHIEVSVKDGEFSSGKKTELRYSFDFNPDEDASSFLRVIGGIDCLDKDSNGSSNTHSATTSREYCLTEYNIKQACENIANGPTEKNSQPAGSEWWINSMKANPFASIEEERAELSEPYLRYLKELNAFLVSITGDSDVALEKIVYDTKDYDASKKPTVEVTAYKIAYAGVEGVANVDTFVAEGASNKATVLPKAKEVVKEGYTFAGWYLNDKKVAKIAKKNTSDVTVTAKWKENQYKVSYKFVFPKEMKGFKASSKVSDKTKYGYESTVTLLGNDITATKKKSTDVYKLIGWSRTKYATEVEYTIGQEVTHFGGRTAKEKTVTLYPVWEKVAVEPTVDNLAPNPIPSTPGPSVDRPNPDPVGQMVWIPTHGGTKYHKTSTCSNMIDPENVDLAVAKSKGFEPCGRCYK